MICQWCHEDHMFFPSVKRALELLEIKEYRIDCKRSARRWIGALIDGILEGLPDTSDAETLGVVARLVEKDNPEYATILRGIAEKATKARKRGVD